MIYLDNAATTKTDPRLKELVDRFLYDEYANPASVYEYAKTPAYVIESAHKSIAQIINGDECNVFFTSSGSEANTLAILGLEKHLKSIGKTHIISTKYEHPSVLNSLKEMEDRGFSVTYLNTHYGRIPPEWVKNSITENTGFISIMYTNNELGTTNDITGIYNICKEHGIILHSDCVQAMGTHHISLSDQADIITFSGHKFHAPKGIGCLCKKPNIPLTPVIFGGKQEFGLRGGTENAAFIAALDWAVKDLFLNQTKYNNRIKSISDTFLETLKDRCNANGVSVALNVIPDDTGRVLSLRFNGVDAQSLIIMLSLTGICVSAGSACSDNFTHPSHVLKAAGLSDSEAMSTIRVSFSRFNGQHEVITAAEKIAECAKIIKDLDK